MSRSTLSVLIVSLLFAYSSGAFACTCATPTIEERIENAKAIVIGRVKECADARRETVSGQDTRPAMGIVSGSSGIGRAGDDPRKTQRQCIGNQWYFEVEEYIKDTSQLGEKEIIVGSPGNPAMCGQGFSAGVRQLLFLGKNYQTGGCSGNMTLDIGVDSTALRGLPKDQQALQFKYRKLRQEQTLQQLRDWRDGSIEPFAPFWQVDETEDACTLRGDTISFRYQFVKIDESVPQMGMKLISTELSNGEDFQVLNKHRMTINLPPNSPPPAIAFIGVNNDEYELNLSTIHLQMESGSNPIDMKIHSLFLSEDEALKVLDALTVPSSLISITALSNTETDLDGLINNSRFGNAKNEYLQCIEK